MLERSNDQRNACNKNCYSTQIGVVVCVFTILAELSFFVLSL